MSIGDCIAKQWARDPADEGVHCSGIFAHCIYAIRGTPCRLPQEWLIDYFFKTPEGKCGGSKPGQPRLLS